MKRRLPRQVANLDHRHIRRILGPADYPARTTIVCPDRCEEKIRDSREDAKTAKKNDEPVHNRLTMRFTPSLIPGRSPFTRKPIRRFQQAGLQCTVHLEHAVRDQFGNLLDRSLPSFDSFIPSSLRALRALCGEKVNREKRNWRGEIRRRCPAMARTGDVRICGHLVGG